MFIRNSIDVFNGCSYNMHLMDIVTTYLYGSLDKDIYMKILGGFKMPEAFYNKPRNVYSIKLQNILYGLK